jgi:hypothetical protein
VVVPVPLTGSLLEPASALVVPRTGSVAQGPCPRRPPRTIAPVRKNPPIRYSGNRKEPGEEPARPLADDAHDRSPAGLHLVDALRDAGVLAGP